MLGSVVGQIEAAGRVEHREETQDMILELNPKHGKQISNPLNSAGLCFKAEL